MRIPTEWGRARRQIAKTYFRLLPDIQPQENVVRVIAHELGYKIGKNGSSNFVRVVIKELTELHPVE